MNLKVKDLKKTYGGFELDIPELEIKPGDIFGLVGNNGAGKTTFLRLCLDLIRASQGRVLSNGKDVAAGGDWKEYTGAYLDQNFLVDFLTPEEYFDLVACLHDMSDRDIGESLNRLANFFNGSVLKQNKYIRDMSTGNKDKIGIASALLFYPDIILLDEPFANLDPTSRKILSNLLIEINHNADKTMVISSHDIANVADLCTRIAILEDGRIIRDIQTSDKTYEQLQEYFEVEEDYR
jgi:ABC-2 type transport system ATP-binding protein